MTIFDVGLFSLTPIESLRMDRETLTLIEVINEKVIRTAHH